MLKDCIPPCSNHNYRFFFFTDPHRWVKKKEKKRIRMNIINRFVFAVSAERKTPTCNQCFMCTYIHDIYFADETDSTDFSHFFLTRSSSAYLLFYRKQNGKHILMCSVNNGIKLVGPLPELILYLLFRACCRLQGGVYSCRLPAYFQ